MKIKWFVVFVVLLLVSNAQVFGQLGGGFEAGFGYNQLFWNTAANDLFFQETASRTTVYIAPNLRLFGRYRINDQYFLHTSVGFTEIGGRSNEFRLDPEESEDYVDTFTFNILEISFLVGYQFEKFNIAAGLKHNIHNSVVIEPPAYFEQEELTLTDQMPGSSNNLGLRAEYKFSGVLLALEVWIGLEEKISRDAYEYSQGDGYNENHFRLIFAMPIFGSTL